MKFWDASAVVPLLLAGSGPPAIQALLAADPIMLVWWGTEVDCAWAVARLDREGLLDGHAVDFALDRLRQIAAAWNEIGPSDAVREAAVRFLRRHVLRAADALRLGAAFVAAGGRPSTLEIVTLDDRLAAAARKEGFVVTNVESGE